MADIFEALNLIGGRWVGGESSSLVPDKFTGEPITRLHEASRAQVEQAVDLAAAAQCSRDWSAYERGQVLARAAVGLENAVDDFVADVMRDTGFIRSDAQNEVMRTIQTLQLSAEAARQVGTGELIPLDGAPAGAGRLGFTVRFPIGVVGAITPFNSPLNTVAHKVGPALAAGNAVVLKPANDTPLSANALARLLIEAGVPEGMVSVVHGPGRSVGQAVLNDERVGFYTLTGSTAVGMAVQRAAGLRPTQLELGSISSTIVCEDADLTRAVAKIVPAALRKSGQVCTSVQRLYVARSVLAELTDSLVEAVSAVDFGDPADAATGVGPLITRADAERVAAWVEAARAKGARVVQGGSRNGPVVAPTVLDGVDEQMDVMCREIFGPVVCIVPFDDLKDAVARANATPFGLAAGVFTQDIDRALWAARNLRFGGVHINEASSARVDLMPFGGVKDSGHGCEGPIYAAREMTEQRLITITARAL